MRVVLIYFLRMQVVGAVVAVASSSATLDHQNRSSVRHIRAESYTRTLY